tara:strand:- start:474 stop:2363 length:1890 start_codon:yes stop_codon:yes gene_type:complete
MSSVLKGVTSAIVYSPLVLFIFTIIFIIGYGIFYYKEQGTLPDSYIRTIDIIKYVITTIIIVPLKWIIQLLWFIFPIFPSKRSELGYSKWGAWDAPTNNRQFSFVILFIALFCGVIYYVSLNGHPEIIADYSYYINYFLVGVGLFCLAMFFIKFSKNATQTYPSKGNNLDKEEWLFKNSSKYLYTLIAVGVAMGLLSAFAFLVSKNLFFSVSGSVMIMIGVLITALFLGYKYLMSSVSFKNILSKYPIINVLFYSIFIVPCIFFDIVKFLYNELRHTPTIVYYILGFEIVLITLLIIIPIFTKYMYTTSIYKDDKNIIIKNKIDSVEKSLKQMKKRLHSLKKNAHSEKGKRIPSNGWKEIKRRNLNDPDNKDELVLFLINYGYKNSEMCDASSDKNKELCKEAITETIQLIQDHAGEIFDLEHSIKETKVYLEDLKKERDEVKKIQKAKILLRDPIYLKNKKYLANHQELKSVGYDIQYNYNYAISAWFFIRAQPPNYGDQYRKHTTILDYGGKPNISYNGLDNSLKITMNNGKNKKPIIYKINDFPLQKWNNIVINYDSGILDIFMNSKLMASFKNVVPYMTLDNISVGDDNGIGGGVCNVLYFPRIMTKERINANYMFLKNNNPPIV